jgi:hypothetical protein
MREYMEGAPGIDPKRCHAVIKYTKKDQQCRRPNGHGDGGIYCRQHAVIKTCGHWPFGGEGRTR